MSVLINASTSSGLVQTADTSGTLELQSNGTTQLTVSSTGAYGQLKSGTAVASTSGTSIDFTGLPSWVKRITVMFKGVSLSGNSDYIIRLGSGSILTTGYSSYGYRINPTPAGATQTVGLVCTTYASTTLATGLYVLDLQDTATNTWVGAGSLTGSGDGLASFSNGFVALSGALDRLRVTTSGGTDTFDAGSINILYEG